jgi:hypothetical protein
MMAKKRHHESRSKMLERHEYYAGEKSRRHQEHADGGMIHEDHSAMANMPQHIIMKPYPKPGGYLPENLDDTIRGVDGLMRENESKRSQHMKPKKT